MKFALITWAFMSVGAVAAAPPVSDLEFLRTKETDLKFDNLFPRRPYSGKSARPLGWSPDDRYLAYLWNPYEVRGMDLWLYDSHTGESKRLTSIDMMAKTDADAKKAIEFYKKDEERLQRWDTLSDMEWRKERQKFKEDREKQKEPDPSYAGVSTIVWANKAPEFIMQYRGDLWRWKLGSDAPIRITQTRDSENNVSYLPDDSGYVFQRGSGLYKRKFGSEFERQIDPVMPSGYQAQSYNISPDGKQLLVFGGKPGAPDRQVDYIVYRDRFAQARKTSRGVSEDNFNGEQTLYLFDITDAALDNIDNDQKPYEIYKWPGGEEYWYLSIGDKPWSPDGKSMAFATFKRDSKQLTIFEADLSKKKVRTVYEATSDGEHQSPSYCQPFYTKDGRDLVCLLDKSGWRQIHLIERIWGKERQLTSGQCETFPVKLSADGKSILATSNLEHHARTSIYRVGLDTGGMVKLTQQVGTWGDPTFGNVSDVFASRFNSWSAMPELQVVSGGHEKVLTDSHRKEKFWPNIVQKPDLFSYTNRHGDTVYGYMFVPKNINDGKQHPLFIYVYGGPLGVGNSVEDGTFNSTAYLFLMYLTQVLGYVTVTIDPRGQSGYSAAMSKANWENPGAAQNEDLVDLVTYCRGKYPIDSSKVGLTGWSFGGYQTQYCMYNSPDVFTLGIAGAGPTEWQNYNTWYTGGVIGNSPKGDGAYLDKYSLTKVCQNLKSPLLLLHGMEDTNVLYQDTVMVYRKLLQAGKGDLVELSLDPTGGHGMGGDMDNRDRHMIYLSYLLKHWGFPEGMSR